MTTSTSGTTMPTTDIGYAKQHQYVPGGKLAAGGKKRKHSVIKDELGRWVTRCTGKPATREYKGWVDTVTCPKCQEKLEEME